MTLDYHSLVSLSTIFYVFSCSSLYTKCQQDYVFGVVQYAVVYA